MNKEIIQQTGFAHLDSLPCVKLQFGEATSVVSLYGGQVLSYQSAAGHEVLWLSSNASWLNGTAIRGGVPVCWPWFGPIDTSLNPEQLPLPNHGLVRNRLWRLHSTEMTDTEVIVSLVIVVDDIPALLVQPGSNATRPTTLKLVISLSEKQLSMQLQCDSLLYQQAALHSYFRVNKLESTKVSGLSQYYYDKVTDKKYASNLNEIAFSAETDRIYFETGKQLKLTDGVQQLTIEQQGHDASIIWNPWQQKSRALPDMEDHGFSEFVCVETARLSLTNSESLLLSQRLNPNT